jgi:hypothetical protein
MRAMQGDRIVIRGKTVEAPDRHGEVVEVRGPEDGPPYLIRFNDGHVSLIEPGSDFAVEHVESA